MLLCQRLFFLRWRGGGQALVVCHVYVLVVRSVAVEHAERCGVLLPAAGDQSQCYGWRVHDFDIILLKRQKESRATTPRVRVCAMGDQHFCFCFEVLSANIASRPFVAYLILVVVQ